MSSHWGRSLGSYVSGKGLLQSGLAAVAGACEVGGHRRFTSATPQEAARSCLSLIWTAQPDATSMASILSRARCSGVRSGMAAGFREAESPDHDGGIALRGDAGGRGRHRFHGDGAKCYCMPFPGESRVHMCNLHICRPILGEYGDHFQQTPAVRASKPTEVGDGVSAIPRSERLAAPSETQTRTLPTVEKGVGIPRKLRPRRANMLLSLKESSSGIAARHPIPPPFVSDAFAPNHFARQGPGIG